jgi:hypothetical protein
MQTIIVFITASRITAYAIDAESNVRTNGDESTRFDIGTRCSQLTESFPERHTITRLKYTTPVRSGPA